MNKERYQKFIEQQRLLNKDKPCEQCGKVHDHSYGSGRFCSLSCKQAYIVSVTKDSPKRKAHLKKLHDKNRVPYGTWKCEQCNLIFETRAKLDQHNKEFHGKITSQCLVGKEKKFACPYCSKEFDTSQQMGGHISNCLNHPNKKCHDEGHKKSRQTYKQRKDNGEYDLTHLGFGKGSHHTLETRQKISQKRAEQVQNEYLNKFHAKVKWYKVQNLEGKEFSVRGMWEVNVSKHLNELGLVWIKAQPIKYFKDYTHNYIADFYIPTLDIYIEVKGRYPDTDREKMRLVVEQNPDKKIYFIHDKYQDFITGKIPFDDQLIIKKSDL